MIHTTKNEARESANIFMMVLKETASNSKSEFTTRTGKIIIDRETKARY